MTSDDAGPARRIAENLISRKDMLAAVEVLPEEIGGAQDFLQAVALYFSNASFPEGSDDES